MDEALKMIRDQMGSDAMIISTLNEGDRLRVTAACDKLPEKKNVVAVPQKPLVNVDAVKNRLCQIIAYHSLSAQDSEALITALYKLPRSTLENGLEGIFEALFNFNPFAFSKTSAPPKQIMLAGPVGAGKTVTLAKLAIELLLAEKKPVILSCDVLKAGALEQLQAYARALQVDSYTCSSPQELEQTLERLQNQIPQATFLIDTPGVNPFNTAEIQQLTQFILASKLAPIMVLPAGCDPLETLDHALALKDLGCTKFITTRMDAARRYGGLLSALFNEHLDLYALSAGPEIANRLHPGSAKTLVHFVTSSLPEPTQELQKENENTPANSFGTVAFPACPPSPSGFAPQGQSNQEQSPHNPHCLTKDSLHTSPTFNTSQDPTAFADIDPWSSQQSNNLKKDISVSDLPQWLVKSLERRA